ncbi:hypothetical protein MJL08_13500, partial [Salmonella enterica subsp. enterica serovar Montevideo]|nr:hypothetical protein [Salmonella enterica subsp. enterica serovar Montevideo]
MLLFSGNADGDRPSEKKHPYSGQSVHRQRPGKTAPERHHYLDWTSDTTEKTSKKSHKDDFGYLELEGGANFSWGEMYGFF